MDVAALTGLLHEVEEHHAQYEAAAPPHAWQDWYAAYIVSREQGRSPDESSAAAARHVETLSR